MKVKRILPLLILLAITSTIASARDEEPQDRGNADERAACTPDVFRLCSAYIPDVPNIVACLKTEKRNLSAECRGVMERRNVRKVKG